MISEAGLLAIVGLCLLAGLAVACFVYAWGSPPDPRVDAIEAQLKHLKAGMKRANAWRSEYDIPSPPLKIKDGSA